MFRIYIPSRVLLDIYFAEGDMPEEKQSYFCRMIKRANTIFMTGVDLDNCGMFDERDASDAHFLQNMETKFQITLHNADKFIDEVKEDNSKVLEQPYAAFYIDGISPEEAAKIQEDYGVICQSADEKPNMDLFMENMETYDLTKYHKDNINNQKWKDIFEVPHIVPSNAVCIIDRNLFAYDGETYLTEVEGEETLKCKYDGLINLQSILREALPTSFKGNHFDVTIFFEQDSFKGDFSFEKLSNTIFGLISMLQRPYQVRASVIAFRPCRRIGDNRISPAKFYNEITHTRQIISSYYRISAENGLNTTMHDDNNAGKSQYSQVLYSMLLFSSGLKRRGADPAAISINRLRIDVRRMIKHWRENPKTDEYMIACNYKPVGARYGVEDFQNRLFL